MLYLSAENVKQILHHETMANQVAILNEKLKKSEPSHTDVDEEDLILAAKLGKALLENSQAEKDNLLASTLRDLENLRTSNHYLTEKLEIVSNSISSTACKESLMSEIEHFEGESWTQSW